MTLVELLRSRAASFADRRLYTQVGDSGDERGVLTYAELDARSRRIAAVLQGASAAGERAVLLYPPGLEYIAGLFGAVYAGLVAVPAYPPAPARFERTLPRLRAIIEDAQATVVLTTSAILAMSQAALEKAPDLAALRWVASDAIPPGAEHSWRAPATCADALAILQYTSGSTGAPKGVMLGHRNLLHNLDLIARCFGAHQDTVGVSWLPPYHDMGLIGGILEVLYCGAQAVLMQPLSFVKRPALWLETISRYRATHSGAPNFGYDLCVKRVSESERQGLDLESWRLAFCGAEPINPRVIDSFSRTFAPHGFERGSFLPCYGLAEATLLVTSKPLGTPPVIRALVTAELEQGRAVPAAGDATATRTLVGCGRSGDGHEVAVVDPVSLERCAAGVIGEIWVSGPSNAVGYWNRPEDTAATFAARIASGDPVYLRTGDLGVELDGELYVAGRLKDLIIVRGRKHYPQDIEATAGEAHPALRAGGSAAFSIDRDGEDRLVVVQEVHARRADGLDPVMAAIQRRVIEDHGVQPHAIALIAPGLLPRTTSGKVRRRETRSAFLAGELATLAVLHAAPEIEAPAQPPCAPAVETAPPGVLPIVEAAAAASAREDVHPAIPWTAARLRSWLRDAVARRTRLPAATIDAQRPLVEYGLDSVAAVEIAGELGRALNRPLSATLVWDYPTLDGIAAHLCPSARDEAPAAIAAPPVSRDDAGAIAIIAIGCRFPGGVDGPDSFWQLLCSGRDPIGPIPASRWDSAAHLAGLDPQHRDAARVGGFLDQVDEFDASFFAISPREAQSLDPQHRLLLEVCYEALDRAGLAGSNLRGGSIGVFVGISSHDYYLRQERAGTVDPRYSVTGNLSSVAAGRVAYALGLVGPAIAVDVACASSLAAVHLACQSLRAGECDHALAGGVNLILSPEGHGYFSAMRATSPRGRCATFDASADGYVRSEGCGIVLLKPLEAARRAGDRIVAVIRDSAINHDGRSNGLTAPNGPAQEAVIRRALARAAVRPDQVSYVETHGTGTPLGDPIEVQSLAAVFGPGRATSQPIRIGSAKSNIGHAEAAAGIAGLIKTALALDAGTLPGNLHFRTPNPHINWAEMPLAVVAENTPWPRTEMPRFAGVSSFGFSGTNVHVVLEQAPAAVSEARAASPDMPQLFAIAAHGPEALDARLGQLDELARAGDVDLADLAFSFATSGAHLPHRTALVTTRLDVLAAAAARRREPGSAPIRKVAFLFGGQGVQRPGMGRQLAERWPVVANALERCDELFAAASGLPRRLREVMWAAPGTPEAELLQRTEYTQPAIFAFEYALLSLWRSLGVAPDLVLGHSVGELAAACAASVIDPADAMRLVVARGLAMARLPAGGAMLSVAAGEDDVASMIHGCAGMAIAAVNGPRLVVVAGPGASIATLEQQASRVGWHTSHLAVSHAFHSPLMAPAVAELGRCASRIRFCSPQIPFLSTVTASRVDDEVARADYWTRHLVAPVRFHDAMAALPEDIDTLVDLGPRPALIAIAKRSSVAGDRRLYACTGGEREDQTLLETVAALYQRGLDLDPVRLFDRDRRRIALPAYPWQRRRHWIDEPATPPAHTTQAGPSHPERSQRMLNGSTHASSGDRRSSAREAQILAALSQLLAHQLRIPVADLDPRRPFLELGADSMVFLEVAHRVEQDYGVTLLPHQLFEEVTDLVALAGFVARHEVTPAPLPTPAPHEPQTAVNDATAALAPQTADEAPGADRLRPIIERQLELMAQQLRLLEHGHAAVEREPPPAVVARPAPRPEPEAPASLPGAHQQRHVGELIRRYNARTVKSKDLAQRYRAVLADRRSTAGFAIATKELQYPIVGTSGRGARLRDLDGNEYIDVSMGFGVHLFGHAPDFIHQAIGEQLAEGAQIGPQSARAGELAEHIARMTGLDRVTFCNSGTEAVMTALRLARAATGRNGVVMFRGSYHGHSDGTLALGRRDAAGHPSIPMAPGVPQGAVDDILVLDYDDPGALDVIRGAADRLAAVLVEPIQSRRPDVQPHGFLRQLRALTRELDIALIFDEVITGFRVHVRGAQGMFGIDADLATYGKLLGGGMPIGVIAGQRRYLDRIDGGSWRFDDDSRPPVETTFFAGTFSKHPLTVAASLAVVRELTARGPALYAQLEARTARLARGMNELFSAEEVPLSLVHCGSIFRVAPRGGNDRASYLHESLELRLLYAHLIHKGIYVWEGRTGFLSTAHTDEDVDRVVAATAEAIAEMRDGGFFVRTRAAPARRSEPVAPPAPRIERAPLSWAQEGLWLQAQLETGTGSFNMPSGVRLRGQLRVDLLERAIGEVIRRHAVLRTRFETVDGSPQQVITPAEDVAPVLDRIDGRIHGRIDARIDARIDGPDRGAPNREALRQLAVDEARRPFDLERGPLLRVTLITLAADEWVLLVTMHHLIGDGWSFGLFVRELSAVYRAYCGEAASTLPPPAVQYADYARRQRERLDDGALERQLAYWKAQLAGAPASLSLPTDRPRRDGAAGRSATLARTVSPALLRAMQDLAKASHATLHMVLLAGFAALLQRHSGQDDILIGAPVTTRDRAELGRVLGLFLNTVVFRLSIDRQRGFTALLQQARAATVGAYAHQEVPFGHVVKALQPARIPGCHPLFQVWFNLEPASDPAELRLPGIDIEPLDEAIDTPTQLDLSLGAELRGDTLVLKWIYNETTFDPATIDHLCDQLVHLLAQVVAAPEVALTSHSLVTPRASAILPDPAAPLDDRDYPRVTDGFARQVDRSAGHAAIVHGARTWSYGELWRAAVGIADGLAAVTRRGDVVAVQGAPSFGLVAAMLGVLLHDRVLLPLDPGLPPSRKALMLRHAGARCLIDVGAGELDRGHDIAQARVGADDATWTAPPPASAAAAADDDGSAGSPPRQAGDAYIFYTSGTTGTPKAVLGTHRGLAHFIEWQRTAFDIGPADRIAQTMRLSFDAVLRDVFLPLCSGATLVLPEHDLAEPASVLAWLAEQRITLLHTVPSLGQHWTARVDDSVRLPDLRRVFFAGEPLQAELVQRWRRLAPAALVINLYGPTETTMTKCYFPVPDEPAAGVQPAGAPLPGTQALVLTPERARCGVGEIGEIVLRTAYATRGYLDAAAHPAQPFIVNPYRPSDDIRLYCTGDLGRYRADGQLQILGRTDRQIKLRGVRIELAEIESVLGTHPRIRQASVQLVGDEPAARQLVAFVVADPASPRDVMAVLRARLPDAMIPGRLVFLDELPRLRNGKIDAAALVSLAAAPVAPEAPVTPMTPTQALVAGYARDLLEVETLGIHDNFFALGGHSLLGAQLVARLRVALGVELSLRALFDNPTVAGFSEHIDTCVGASERALALALQARDDDRATETVEL